VEAVNAEYHVLNLGAGVQSTRLYLAFALGEWGLPKLECAIFADTQEEPARVYKHLDWLKSLVGAPPILTVTIGRLGDHLKAGRNSTGGRFVSIPAFTTNGVSKGQTRRQCSNEYKIVPIKQAIRRRILGLAPGVHVPRGVLVHQYFGISIDEECRATPIERALPKYMRAHFPLVEHGVTRWSCEDWLASRVPHKVPRSACVFCPYHSDQEWLEIKSVPEDWNRAVEIDEALRTAGSVVNRAVDQTMYLHPSFQALTQIEFKPKTPKARQQYLSLNKCVGVCGV
jgi:hypothetical protein